MLTPQLARSIVEALANGIDPFDGSVLPSGRPWDHPHVVRALFVAVGSLREEANNPAKPKPAQMGQPWTLEEDRRLLATFDEGASVAALMQARARSSGAIRSRLIRFGRLGPNSLRLG